MSDTDFTAGFKTERMTDIALAYKKSQTLNTAVELGLFTAISEGNDTLEKIANALGLDAEKVDRLLTVCKAIELVQELDGSYRNMSDVERYLVKNHRTYFGDYLVYIAKRDYDAWTGLTENLTATATVEESNEGDERTYLSVMDDPDYAREFTVAAHGEIWMRLADSTAPNSSPESSTGQRGAVTSRRRAGRTFDSG